MEPDGKNFLLFWTNFLPFYPLTTQQVKILRIIKIPGYSVHWGINPCQPPSFLKLWWEAQPPPPCPHSTPSRKGGMVGAHYAGDIIILLKCTKNHDHMLHCPEMKRVTEVIFIFYFGLFFAILSPCPLPKKLKF